MLYFANAVRFCKQYRADSKSPVYSSLLSAYEAERQLKVTPWTYIQSDYSPILTTHEETTEGIPFRDYYDAYLLCAEHTDSTHRAYAGAVAYRIKITDEMVGGRLYSFSFTISGDPYNEFGNRVAIRTTNDGQDYPSENWTEITEGGIEEVDKFYAEGVVPRLVTVKADGLTYWTPQTIKKTISKEGGLVLGRYLWLYLSMENYHKARNGWLEGSAAIVPQFEMDAIPPTGTVIPEGEVVGDGYVADPLVILANDTVFSPKSNILPPSEMGLTTYTREIFSREYLIGNSTSRNIPTPENAISAIPPMMANLMELGTPAVDVMVKPMEEWSERQIGISTSVVRRVAGESEPFEHKLVLSASCLSMLVSFPEGFKPSLVRLVNTEADGTIRTVDVDLKISVFFAEGKNIPIESLGTEIDKMAWYGETAANYKSFQFAGERVFPRELAPGASFTIPVSFIGTDPWGTLLIIAQITRISATGLVIDTPVGLNGVEVTETDIKGRGWLPDVYLEM